MEHSCNKVMVLQYEAQQYENYGEKKKKIEFTISQILHFALFIEYFECTPHKVITGRLTGNDK